MRYTTPKALCFLRTINHGLSRARRKLQRILYDLHRVRNVYCAQGIATRSFCRLYSIGNGGMGILTSAMLNLLKQMDIYLRKSRFGSIQAGGHDKVRLPRDRFDSWRSFEIDSPLLTHQLTICSTNR